MPLRMALTMISAIFLCEFLIMLALQIWPVDNGWISILVDSTVLAVLLVPVLYFFFVQPMDRTVRALKISEAELREYKNNLENLIKERTLQLENANVVIRQIEQAKSDFFANVSHELRTPLNAILGFSDLMLCHRGMELSEKQRDFLEEINEAGRHMLSMVTKLLDMSELMSGNNELVRSEVCVTDLINETAALIQEEASRKKINTVFNIDENIGTIEADKEKLKHVMANLLSNAVKFSQQNGRITVSAARNSKSVKEDPGGNISEHLKISVIDSGPGIRSEEIHKVFSPFQQAGSVYSKDHGGAGISLAVCKYFIEAHGGAISVESEWGKGANFTISLPIYGES